MNINQEYIQSVINGLTDNEKKRLRVARETQLFNYFYFDVSVFNSGSVTRIRQTNNKNEKNLDDGTSFYLPTSTLNLFNI